MLLECNGNEVYHFTAWALRMGGFALSFRLQQHPNSFYAGAVFRNAKPFHHVSHPEFLLNPLAGQAWLKTYPHRS